MPRIHPADEQATLDLATTQRVGKRLSIPDRIFLIVSALFLLGFGLTIFILPQESFSEQENRALQTMPAITPASLADNALSQDIADFYADQFPAREFFVGLKTLSEMSQLKYENNGVLIGKDGYLIKRLEYGEDGYENIRANTEAVADFGHIMAERDIPVTLAIAPRGIDVLTSHLPDYYDTARANAAWTLTLEAAAEAGITPVTFTEELRMTAELGTEVGDGIWFRTDHHWTPRGAYLAYVLLAKTLGYTPLPFDTLTAETVDAPFYGTTYSSAGISWAQPDTLTFYHLPNEERFLCEIVDTGKSFRGFYDRSYLDTKDKYGALIAGNNGRVRITDTEHPDKPTLLILKDSFAHAAVPYLAEHFQLEILDLRYWRGSTADLVGEIDADHILILTGLDSLATAKTYELLRFGAP